MGVNSLPNTASQLWFEPWPFCAWVQHASHSATEPHLTKLTTKKRYQATRHSEWTSIFLVQSFTADMPLLTAASALELGRRCWSSPQLCYLHCLRTILSLYLTASVWDGIPAQKWSPILVLTGLIVDQLSWYSQIALGPAYEYPPRQSIHLSMFYTLHCVKVGPDKWYPFKRVIHLERFDDMLNDASAIRTLRGRVSQNDSGQG